jgi:hypothetical protein
MVPANESLLSRLKFRNGSLDSGSYIWNEWSRAENSSHPVNLTILSDQYAALQFLAQDRDKQDQNYGAKLALVRTVLSTNYNSGSVLCVYPISGSYDFLPRILFYMLLLFALLYRRHTWVAVAALGTAMTYSATTAVHAFALLTQYGWTNGNVLSNIQSAKEFGDFDLFGTLPVLLAASIMFAPILHWSKNVRRDKAQIVMVLWGMLCFAALVPVTIYGLRAYDQNTLHGWSPNAIPALMLCPRSVAESNLACVMPMKPTLENYTACQCFDFCGLLAPPAPMRSGPLSAWLPKQIYYEAAVDKVYLKFFNYSGLFSIFIVCYGALGLMHSYFSLREMRNLMLRVLSTPLRDYILIWNLGRRKASMSRVVGWNRKDFDASSHEALFVFAKSVAAFYYVLGMLVAIFCPLTSVAVIFNIEIVLMNQFSYSEGNDAVGAWGPWVGTAFISLVAVILQYQDRWEAFLLRSGERLLSILGFDGLTRTGASQQKDPPAAGFSFTQFGSHILRCSIGGAYSSVKLTWIEFGDWIKAPLVHSPVCSCEGCILYRNLVRDALTIRDDADSCSCHDCGLFREKIGSASRKHGSICGCRLCQSLRDQTQSERRDTNQHSCSNCARKYEDLNTAEPIPAGYRTLGMRILRSFDRRLLDMLEEADATAAMVPLASMQRADSTTSISLDPIQRVDTTTAIPLVPLQRADTTASLDSIRSSNSSRGSSIDSQEPRMT